MKLYIKNMVCNRCISAVENLFRQLDFQNFKVSMGFADLEETEIPAAIKEHIKGKLHALGFELIDDKKSKLIETIKNIIITKIHYEDITDKKINWSGLITNQIHYEYKYLSRLFSSVESITIEQYIIHQKIEKAKELIVYDELTLSEIAWKLGYSSVAHLSNQFKKVTGMPSRDFKLIGIHRRKPLDEV